MINIVELFSGIGSQAKAFERLSRKRNFQLNVLKTCEWDVHAIVAYDYIHNGSALDKRTLELKREDLLKKLKKLSLSNDGKVPMKLKTLEAYSTEVLRRIYSAILKTNNMISVKDVKGEDIPNNVTVMTYSFPCQDLSNVGALHGYNKGIDRDAHTRSGLLWEVERILVERQQQNLDMPKFLLLENVTALEAKRHSKNFNEWKERLESLGYVNQVNRLYAPDFGIPQNRKRLLMLSVYVGDDENAKQIVKKYFEEHDLNDPKYIKTLNIKMQKLSRFLKLDYTNKTYLDEAVLSQPNDTESRKSIWEKNSKILLEDGTMKNIVQTITTKQDRHPNSGNIYFNPNNNKSKYRFLTPRECFVLMGFDEKDYEKIINNNFNSKKNSLFFSRDKMYKLAGNSIVVNMLEAIFEQAMDLNNILFNEE